MPFDRDRIKARVAALAAKGVFIGTSSWKYPGWFGQVYTPARYEYRGKVAKTRFERDCLREYAEVFKTVGVDAAYYKFPDRAQVESMIAQVPEDFLFALKVTDGITIKRFANLARFGERAGKVNEHFLNADLFADAFLRPCEPFRKHIGLLMFEFSRFHPADYAHGRDFVADLDKFLGQIPPGWPYGVEIRNEPWLQPDYFGCLSRHGVTHIFNSWNAMPPVGEQMKLPGSVTRPELVAARFQLIPGCTFERAVKKFEPYDAIKETNPAGRAAARQLIAEGERAGGKRKTFVYVNNRFEGNAPGTISAILSGSE